LTPRPDIRLEENQADESLASPCYAARTRTTAKMSKVLTVTQKRRAYCVLRGMIDAARFRLDHKNKIDGREFDGAILIVPFGRTKAVITCGL
jgi:hypothetical protein